MKPHRLQYLLLVAGLLQIVQGFTGSIMSEMAGRGRGGVCGNTACAIAGGIGEDGLSFVGSVQQCRFGGRASGMDGAWLTPSAAGAYPHRTWLDTCATKTGTGVRSAREHNDWRITPWPEANQFRVNSSPRYCSKCRLKMVARLDALQPDGNEGTVTVESGQGEGGSGGTAADGAELELKNLCEDVVCSQLLKRVASLRRSLAAVKKKTVR
jgi:hypothetical protein